MTRVAVAVLLAALLGIPPLLGSYQIYLLSLTLVWSLLALSMGLLLGYVGQINFGQAGFVAIAAYVSSLLRIDLGLSFWLAVPVALAAVVLVAACIGVVTFRLRGPFFVLVTLAFGEIVRIVITNWQDVTNGPIGLRGIPRPEGALGIDFARPIAFYYLALAVTLLATLALVRVVRSRTGRLLVALREDELLAGFVGIAVMRQKVIGLCISALVAGLGGVLIGPLLTVISPGQFTVFTSVDMVVMVVVGGVGSLAGPLIGAVFLIYVPELVRFSSEYRPVMMGVLLILVTMFLPTGLLGVVRRLVPAEALLSVTGLTKRFAGLTAVDDVSFAVHGGEILGLIGPNGAGKTTTFNLISGRLTPTAGRVRLAGHDIVGLRPDRVVALGLARTFQGTRVFPNLTVAENLHIPLLARQHPALSRRVEETLDFVGLTALRGAVANSLAYAHQSLLGIGLALVQHPKLLLLDEPFAGMNPAETRAAALMVRRIRDRGITVVLIEHDVAAVMETCDRIVVFDHGRLIAEGTPERIRRDPAVIEAYLGADVDA